MSQSSCVRYRRTAVVRLFAAVCASAVLTSCDRRPSEIAGPDPSARNLGPYLAGSAAAAVGPNGLFSVSAPAGPLHRPIITAERAGELALAYVRSFGPSLKPAWEKDRGAVIDMARLEIVSRILYARTPYVAFPAGYHPAFERAYGPYYLVPLGSEETPELLVAVSAYATDVAITRQGTIKRPVQRGNEFVTRGIPADASRWRLVAPEEAVEITARTTGARVIRAPEFVRLGMPAAPGESAWKLTLEREIPVHAKAGGQSRVRTIYVGPNSAGRLMIAVPGAARAEVIPAVRLGAGDDDSPTLLELRIQQGESGSLQPFVHGSETN